MGLKKSLLSGIVAFVVATLVARAVAGKRTGTTVGLLAGVAVAGRTLLAGRTDDIGVESTEEIAAE